jgi:hypothetical protein
MAAIGNDHEFKLALDRLDQAHQRLLGAHFVASVLDLCRDPRIRRAVQIASDPQASEIDLDEAFRSAKSVAVKTYTDCGKDTDWMSQAAHFVAAAAAACLTPEGHPGGDNPAWKTAMQARMARNCQLIEQGDADGHDESAVQYRLAAETVG